MFTEVYIYCISLSHIKNNKYTFYYIIRWNQILKRRKDVFINNYVLLVKMKALKVDVNNGIAVVTFDNPPLNLFNYSIYNEFKEIFDELSENDKVVVVVLIANGKNFSVGHDVKELQAIEKDNIDEHYRIVGEGLAAIYKCKKPTVAAVNGMAVGAGLAAVAACDVIIASEDATFSIPEIRVGIIGAPEFLQLLVPKKIARYYSYTGKALSAYKVYQYGGILEIVPKEHLINTAIKISKDIMEYSSPIALSYFKQAMNDNDNAMLLEKFYHDKYYGRQFIETEDSKETTLAFFEKRKPKYNI
jgi:enoyl-CoA hydratase